MNQVQVQRAHDIAAGLAARMYSALHGASGSGSSESGRSGAGPGRGEPARETAPIGAAKALWHGVKRLLPDYAYMKIQHRRLIGRWPDLRRPVAFNESILVRCLHPDGRWIELTDKLAVRNYVREKVGDEYLIPLVAAPEKFTREVFDSLPTSFVMKANHGCAFVKLVRDKSMTSFEELSRLAKKWLATDFSKSSRERHYRFIQPRIFFEQLLLDERGRVPADLKLHVFGGRPEGARIHTMVISDRFGDARGDIYDEHWNRIDVRFGPYTPSDTPSPRPANWVDIERVALRLAEDFDYVRVDLYSLGQAVYFGELTFTPGAGVLRYTPDSYDYWYGRMLKESVEGFERMRWAGCA